MRAFKYFLSEAAASLWRGRKAAILSILTISGGLFVLGFFLVLNANLQRLVGRWTESAELSVYLKDEATEDQLRTVDDLIAGSGLAAERQYISKNQAIARFKQDFPDLAGATSRLESNPFPASFEIRLKLKFATRVRPSTIYRQPWQACRGWQTFATIGGGWRG
jgi:cell division transport system permease protein